jgi:heme oxygenase
LHAGELPKVAGVNFLRSLSIIYAVLESSLARVPHPQTNRLRVLATPKLPLLMADLELFDAARIPSVKPAIQRAVGFGAEILADDDNPLSPLGALYVLEGSQNGGISLRRALARCLGVPERRLSFMGCYGKETAAHWRRFSEAMDSLPISVQQANHVARCALHCFEKLESICAALYPYSDEDLGHHVAAVNFEAGDHAMPQKPLEMDLALRAAKTAWEKYPYLELRFGERGKRFTDSDGCWLVALAHMPVETATQNLTWLRTFLASRGIPTVILEAHIRAILDALEGEFPDRIDMRIRYAPFQLGLDAERQARGDTEQISRLVDRFDRRLRRCSGFTVESAARLIASAWEDECSGIAGSLRAVQEWFVDPTRFPNDWTADVNELVAGLAALNRSS